MIARNPFADKRDRFHAGRLGMLIFLASLAMLFIASIVGFVVIRTQSDTWPKSMPVGARS